MFTPETRKATQDIVIGLTVAAAGMSTVPKQPVAGFMLILGGIACAASGVARLPNAGNFINKENERPQGDHHRQ